jgi:hypothetical protein
MASVILSGTPAGLAVDDPVLANPVVASGAGGGSFVGEWDGTEYGTGKVTCQMGAGAGGGSAGVQFLGGATPATQQLRWAIGTNGPENGDGVTGNDLNIWAYSYPQPAGVEVLVDALTITRSNGAVNFEAPVQCGITPILANGAQTIDVANTAVTATSVIITQLMGAEDTANVTIDGVLVNPGVGFTVQLRGIVSSPVPTVYVSWFIPKF